MIVVPVPLLINVPARLMIFVAVGIVFPKVGLAAVSTGAALGLTTVSEAVSVAVLKAAALPLVDVSAVPPFWPEVVSQAR